MKTNLVIASQNKGKIKEFSEFLASLPVNIIKQPKDFEVEEIGQTFAENAKLKAYSVSKLTGEIALADDSGLCVNALSGAPGIMSARYGKDDKARINRLLNELNENKDRSAIFISSLCIASAKKNIFIEVEGCCQGWIVDKPRGNEGFGYDPIFQVKNTGLTFAQMDRNQKKFYSHRGKAFSALKPLLNDFLVSKN